MSPKQSLPDHVQPYQDDVTSGDENSHLSFLMLQRAAGTFGKLQKQDTLKGTQLPLAHVGFLLQTSTKQDTKMESRGARNVIIDFN